MIINKYQVYLLPPDLDDELLPLLREEPLLLPLDRLGDDELLDPALLPALS